MAANGSDGARGHACADARGSACHPHEPHSLHVRVAVLSSLQREIDPCIEISPTFSISSGEGIDNEARTDPRASPVDHVRINVREV